MSPCVSSLCVRYGGVSVISVVSLFLALSLCVWSLGCCVLLSWVCVFLVSFFYVSLYVCRVSLMCLGGLLVVYGCWWSMCFFCVPPIVLLAVRLVCLCCWWVCLRVLFFLFSFFFCVFVCVPRFCVWFWVCGGLFLGGCLVGLGFGVVGFWVWGGGFVLWGGCWWCCFLGVVGVGVVLWAILLLLLLLLFFCLECGFGGCWAWCCCW